MTSPTISKIFYAMHQLFRLKEYKPGTLVLGTKEQKAAEQGLYDWGERLEALIDWWLVDALDYELVDIFNWQEEAAGMISQMEFGRRVDVQTETIERYVRDGLLVPNLVVPMIEHRTFKYFKEETLQKYAQQYGWTLIDDSNRKDLFLDMVRQMDMSYSYKPVLLKAVLLFADDKGRMKLSDIVAHFWEFYEARWAAVWWWKRPTVSTPRAAIPTPRPSGTSCPIPSNGLRICRCSTTPRLWV